MPDTDQLFSDAQSVNATFKQVVGNVQSQLEPADWRVGQYGDVPVDCDDGYGFKMTRLVPEEWRLSTDSLTTAQQLGDWLGTNGWSDVQVRTYEGGISNVVLQARNEEAHVDRLDVDIQTGSEADSVIIRATSTCQAGDPNELMAVLYPGWPTDTIEHDALPETEAPDADPVFGFTDSGAARRP